MQWKEPPPDRRSEQPARGDADDLAIGKQGLQRRERRGCVGVAVDRHHDDAVGDDEVHVAGGRDLAQRVAIQARRRDAHDLEPAALRVGRRCERARDGVESLGVGVVGAGRRLARDAAGRHEAGEVVDMAVGMVVHETLVEPEDLRRAEGLGAAPLRLRPSSSHCGWG